jgi:hypothetical protein
MTDEERAELLQSLRKRKWCSFNDCPCEQAADEIERLMEEVKNWEVWARSQPGHPYELGSPLSRGVDSD